MNKIKLLTPVFGLAAVSSIIVPLTSCGSKDEEYDYDFAKDKYEPKVQPKKGKCSEENAISTYLTDDEKANSNKIVADDLLCFEFKVCEWTKSLGATIDYYKIHLENVKSDINKKTISFHLSAESKVKQTGTSKWMTAKSNIEIKDVEYVMAYQWSLATYKFYDWMVMPLPAKYVMEGKTTDASSWLSSHDSWSLKSSYYVDDQKTFDGEWNYENFEDLISGGFYPLIWSLSIWESHYFSEVTLPEILEN